MKKESKDGRPSASTEAQRILKENPAENAVHMTSDGQGFFKELEARNHAHQRGLKAPKAFFRSGHEPEDDQELEAELAASKKRTAELETVLGEIAQTANWEEKPVKVDKNTAAETVAVVQLREKVVKIAEEYNALLREKHANEEAEKAAKEDKKETNPSTSSGGQKNNK